MFEYSAGQRVQIILPVVIRFTLFKQENIITNIRFRYNPREGHDLYIVYDEGLNTYRDREIPELPLSSIRTLMLKYSYTFIIGG